MVGPDTITRLRRSAPDRFGDPTGSASAVDITGCVVWPQRSSETTGAQDTVIVGYEALMPPGTDVLATDQLRWRGVVYDIDGQPAVYSSPFSSLDPGVSVSMKVVTG